MQQYINHNGKLEDVHTPLFTADNRGFMYGDALFETIRVINGASLFFEDHMNRLVDGMTYMHMKFSPEWDYPFFESQVKELLIKNNHSDAARVRLEVYRMPGGYYTPSNSDVGFVLQSAALSNTDFALSPKGVTIDVYKDTLKSFGKLSNLKSSNSLCYVLAGIYKNQKSLDDCLLLNTDGHIAETISSNIFAVHNGELFTPALDQACVSGVMRAQVLKIAQANKKKVREGCLTVDDLLKADEVFLTNAINGIRWVVAFRSKRYFNTTAKWFCEQLNLLC